MKRFLVSVYTLVILLFLLDLSPVEERKWMMTFCFLLLLTPLLKALLKLFKGLFKGFLKAFLRENYREIIGEIP